MSEVPHGGGRAGVDVLPDCFMHPPCAVHENHAGLHDASDVHTHPRVALHVLEEVADSHDVIGSMYAWIFVLCTRPTPPDGTTFAEIPQNYLSGE